MKTLALLSFLTLSTLASAATIPLKYTCRADEDTVKIDLGEFRAMKNAYVEVYNQGGLGPNNLEYSAVAVEQTPVYSAGQLVQVDIALPMGGRIFLDIGHNLKQAVGTIKASSRAITSDLICNLDPVL